MNPNVVNILQAEPVGDYRLRLTFDDGVIQIVDFRSFLTQSNNPDIRAWLAPEKFAAFRIDYGELIWGDYELCFPVTDLYYNSIDRRAPLNLAA